MAETGPKRLGQIGVGILKLQPKRLNTRAPANRIDHDAMHHATETVTMTITVRHQQTDVGDRLGGRSDDHISKSDKH